MDDAANSASRRSVTSVDLGPWKAKVAELSAAAGVGPSTWLRELVRRELTKGEEQTGAATAVAAAPARQNAIYRAWLGADLTAKLDHLTVKGGFRSRAAALRGLLEGLDVSIAAGAWTAEAVRALGLSNHHLVAIGRNVDQIAKSLHAAPGKTGTAERIALDDAVATIHQHLKLAGVLVGQLRPLLKPDREKR